ncbi:MAG: tRNA 2-thiouridine(34) synthase MnmA [Lachnospiraceae bacterium]|nr:tRNA 2-thiouridine(34) synthase MnmA [Lachnospiraceae bacterium]
MINKKRVVVGMSGGVDSSVAAYLLKEAGYDVVGVTMEIWPQDTEEEASANGGCCGMRAAEDAARVAQKIGIPHYVMNFREEFREKVIHYFMEEYLAGRTPNPCIACNRYVKWESLLHRSLQIGADYIATGHYARIEQLPNGRYAIRRSVTAAKDQTYALYNLTQEQLAHTLMPVGAYDKPAIRAIAEEIGLTVAHKPDSQEICFVPDQDYAGFIEKNSTRPVPPPGNFVTARGEILGRHRGITHYTIGQRKGLNLSLGHPVFVTEIRPETNEVVIGEAQDVFSDHLYCDHLNYMSVPAFADGMRVTAKIRYNHAGAPATVRRVGDDCAEVLFDEPVRAVTPGQAVVFYDGDSVAGGGTICPDFALLPKIRHISDENLQDIV